MRDQLGLFTPEAAKQNAIAKVEANSQDFVDCAFEIIERLCRQQPTITALDVWAAYSGPPPKHPRAMGAAFMRAKLGGLIKPTNDSVKSGRASDHNQELRVWLSRYFR